MIQEKILDFLKKKPDYISGDQISQRLGVTRQALWKHIQELKYSGYDIVAVPHLGYRLISSPDRLFPAEISRQLNTKFIGKKIYYFDTLSSTMDLAMELGIKGLPEGTLVLTEAQTKGKGRLGRGWLSPKYKGIYLSLILRPKILPHEAPILTLFSAVSVCEAVEETTAQDPQIKWPNDILIHHKKLGGILTELNAEMDEVRFVVVGIGLNVNNDKKTLCSGATSLREHKKQMLNRIELLKEILRKIEKNYSVFHKEGSTPILEKWREYSVTLGRRVKIYCHRKGHTDFSAAGGGILAYPIRQGTDKAGWCHKQHIEGLALDVDSDGGLLIREDSGITQKVMAGDVVHCR